MTAGEIAAGEIADASALESLAFNACHVVPSFLQGLFSRRRFFSRLWTALDLDRRTVRLVARMRRKHGDRLWVRVLGKRSLLVLDPGDVREVLDRSPAVYGPPKIKRLGMGAFQPEAVTLAVGEAWRDKRRFNEAVLDSGSPEHRLAARFLDAVRGEVEALGDGGGLAWEDFEELFERIVLQVVFGAAARGEQAITGGLERLMKKANRVFLLRRGRAFDELYGHLRRHLASPHPECLAARASAVPADESTAAAGQVPHWMFAVKDTLAANTARALALVVSDPAIEENVRAELDGADLASAGGVAGLRYLGGCVQEAMRLWPTTPLLSREALADDRLGDAPVAAGTQVLILNLFNHRDAERLDFADRAVPEIWQGGEPDYRFNHLSNGPQICAGKDLALFLARAVLATLLGRGRYVLRRPPLDPGAPLPHMLDPFRLRFDRRKEA